MTAVVDVEAPSKTLGVTASFCLAPARGPSKRAATFAPTDDDHDDHDDDDE